MKMIFESLARANEYVAPQSTALGLVPRGPEQWDTRNIFTCLLLSAFLMSSSSSSVYPSRKRLFFFFSLPLVLSSPALISQRLCLSASRPESLRVRGASHRVTSMLVRHQGRTTLTAPRRQSESSSGSGLQAKLHCSYSRGPEPL